MYSGDGITGQQYRSALRALLPEWRVRLPALPFARYGILLRPIHTARIDKRQQKFQGIDLSVRLARHVVPQHSLVTRFVPFLRNRHFVAGHSLAKRARLPSGILRLGAVRGLWNPFSE